MIILFALILVLIGVGIALAALGIFLLFGLASLGILSTSLFVGLHQRSFTKGFKVLLILSTVLAGLVAGPIGLGLLNAIYEWWPAPTAVFLGMAGGMIAGLALGTILAYVIKELTAVLRQKLPAT